MLRTELKRVKVEYTTKTLNALLLREWIKGNKEGILLDDEVLDNLMFAMTGGFETTSSTLIAMLHHLAQYPDIQHKCVWSSLSM